MKKHKFVKWKAGALALEGRAFTTYGKPKGKITHEMLVATIGLAMALDDLGIQIASRPSIGWRRVSSVNFKMHGISRYNALGHRSVKPEFFVYADLKIELEDRQKVAGWDCAEPDAFEKAAAWYAAWIDGMKLKVS